MKNNKGFTIVELLVSFVLSMIIVIILFQLIINLKEIYSSSGLKTEMLNKQNIMTDKIYTDLNEKQVVSISPCSIGSTCISFMFADGNTKELLVDKETKTLSYDDYTIKLNSNSYFQNINIMNSETDLTNTYNRIFNIDIPIYNDLFKDENFGINIVYLYNHAQIVYNQIYKKYYDGEIVYFNVTTGKECELEYQEGNSKTGNKAGCMKWYAFLDSADSSTVDLLLDHNTTAMVAWNSSGDNTNGPSDANNYVLYSLQQDTANWQGTETPTDYDPTNSGGTVQQRISYSGYNARLINAEEIANITGQDYWKINGSTISLSNYGWLLDRVSNSCKSNGCSNNAEGTNTYGYWTSSPYSGSSSYAWNVYENGKLCYETSLTNQTRGLRPVITVQKDLLQ